MLQFFGQVSPYDGIDIVNSDSDYGLLPDGTKPLSEPLSEPM